MYSRYLFDSCSVATLYNLQCTLDDFQISFIIPLTRNEEWQKRPMHKWMLMDEIQKKKKSPLLLSLCCVAYYNTKTNDNLPFDKKLPVWITFTCYEPHCVRLNETETKTEEKWKINRFYKGHLQQETQQWQHYVENFLCIECGKSTNIVSHRLDPFNITFMFKLIA